MTRWGGQVVNPDKIIKRKEVLLRYPVYLPDNNLGKSGEQLEQHNTRIVPIRIIQGDDVADG